MLSTSGSTLQVTFIGKHIDNICSRANSSLGFIRRNVNIGNPRVKGQAYQSYVRPVLEYSSTVWDPYTVGSIKKIESVQRRAARFTLGRYRRTSSVNAMRTRKPLASRRHAARLLMFYKIHYGLVATPMPLDIKLHPVPMRVEKSLAYHIPPSSCDYHLYSFSPALFVTGTFFLKRSLGPLPLRYSGVWFTDNPICILVLHRQPV